MGLNQPNYKLVVNDKDQTANFAAKLKSLTITDDTGLADDSLTIEIIDDGLIQIPNTKAIIVASISYNGGFVEMGRYTVNNIDVDLLSQTMTISAGAADMSSAIKSPKTKTWRNGSGDITLGAIAKTIAESYGFALVIDPFISTMNYPVVNQTNESDVNLMRRLADAIGATFKVASKRMILVSKGSAKAASAAPMPSYTFTPESKLSSLRVSVVDRNFFASVTAKYVVEGNPEVQTVTVGEGVPTKALAIPSQTKELAIAAAKKAQREAAQGRRTLSLETIGNPKLRAESVAVLSGWRDGVNGEYVISSVSHNITPNLYSVSIESKEIADK
jgi:phage protein D